MSSNGSNIDKPLELVQRTYNNQGKITTANNEENSQQRSSHTKVSIHQPSRKNSVHDIHQIAKDDFHKIFVDIQENLSRLKVLLETINSAQTIRDEFFKLKDSLLKRIEEFILKLSNESGKRASITSRRSSSSVIAFFPQNLVYSVEYFRNELLKGQYLFSSLTPQSSIGTATLNNAVQRFSIDQSIDNNQDVQQLKKDIAHLDEHIYILTQRYYSQIPDLHNLDESLAGATTGDGALGNSAGLNAHRLRFGALNHKLSTTSSTGSFDNLNIFSRMCQKCHIVCCFCHPNYI